MDNSDMNWARYPDTYYYGIQPTISKVAAEMDDMSVAYPTQEMVDSMADRIYDETMQMYPEQLATESVVPEQRHIRRRPIARDLLAILLLRELLERRRHRHY